MGLFDKLKAASSGLPSDFIERYKTADLSLEENEDLVSQLEYRIKYPLNEKGANYSIFKNFITNISNEDVANYILPSNDSIPVSQCAKLLSFWTVKDASKKDNVFRAVLNNRSFKNLSFDGKFSIYDYEGIYNGYCNDLYGLEEANDENSVIYNRKLWSPSNEPNVERYIEIDNQLRNDPEKRKKILYKEDGKELRSLDYIEQDLEK